MPNNENNTGETLITVSIKTKTGSLFEGKVSTVSSKNERGVFDILPFHANFITLIKDFVILDKGTQKEQLFKLENGGVLTVMSNKVDVYVGL